MLGYRLGGRFVFEDVFHLAIGIALWIVYSWLQADLVIIVANSVSLILLMGIL